MIQAGVKSTRRLCAATTLLTAAACTACTSAGGIYAAPKYLEGRNYAYAVYDRTDALIHSPIEQLRRELQDPERKSAPISDVYVLVHGWNYTVEESVNLYESYRHSLSLLVEDIREKDKTFQPFFVFVVWSSVSRPVTDAVNSILPWQSRGWTDFVTNTVDSIAFHIPSSWGESQDAMRIAVGPPRRANGFAPDDPLRPFDLTETERAGVLNAVHAPNCGAISVDASEYKLAIAAGVERAKTSEFHGFEAPLSVLLEQLIETRLKPEADGSPAKMRLHVVGHSFGGKLAALAVHDAVQRRVAREIVRTPPGDPLPPATPIVDSLVLLLPAMQVSEMFCELPLDLSDGQAAAVRARNQAAGGDLLREGADGGRPTLRYERVAERIDGKVLVYSRDDSANGWVFALGDVLLDHDVIASTQNQLAWPEADDMFYGAYEEVFTKRHRDVGVLQWMCLPLAPVYGAVQFCGRAAYAVGGTVVSDLSAIVDGFDVTFAEIRDDSNGDVWRDVASLPFSPFLVQRSVGNQGFAYVRPGVNLLDVTAKSWLDDEAGKFLGNQDQRRASDFVEASGKTGAVVPDADPVRGWISYNGREVYDGRGASTGVPPLNIIPPGAHNDIHETGKPAAHSDEGDPAKRERTWYFVYNATRGRCRAKGEPGAATR